MRGPKRFLRYSKAVSRGALQRPTPKDGCGMGLSLFRFGVVVLFAFNLRTNLANFSPLIDAMRRDIEIGAFAVSFIGFLPPAAFAVAALLGQPITSRFGLSRATQAAMWAVIVGSLGRAFSPDIVWFAIATAIALAGAGLGNVLLPLMTKDVAGQRVTPLTTANGIVFAIATAVPIFMALPLASLVGWRTSMAVWAFPAAIFLVVWWRQRDIWKSHEPRIPGDKARHHMVRQLRSATAWLTSGVFGVSGFIVYSVFIWYPIFLSELDGTTSVQAATAVTAFALAGVLIYVVIPLSSAFRVPSTVVLIFGFTLFAVFVIAVPISPTSQLLWWFVVGGVGPIVFPVVLISIAHQTRVSKSDVGFSSFVQGVGYALGSLGPLVTGALYAQSGSPEFATAFLTGIALMGIVLVVCLHIFGGNTRSAP